MQTFLSLITITPISRYILKFIPLHSLEPKNIAKYCLVELMDNSEEKVNFLKDLQGY